MSDDHKDMILRNVDSITDISDDDYKAGLLFDIR